MDITITSPVGDAIRVVSEKEIQNTVDAKTFKETRKHGIKNTNKKVCIISTDDAYFRINGGYIPIRDLNSL